MSGGKTYDIRIDVAEDGNGLTIRPVGEDRPLVITDDGSNSMSLGVAVQEFMQLMDKKEKELNPKDKQ